MNPSFMAFQQAMLKASIDLMMGVTSAPKVDREQTDGSLFKPTASDRDSNGFPRSDLVVAQEEFQAAEEKERNTRAHLLQLAAECRERAAEAGINLSDLLTDDEYNARFTLVGSIP